MTVKLYEGCYGVTRSREKRGPIITVRPEQAVGEVRYIFFRVTGLQTYWTKSGVAKFASDSRDDITTVFATEAEADAYLAGDNKPLGQILRDEVAKLTMKPAEYKMNAEGLAGLNKGMANTSDCPHCGLLLHTAPKPVTWPDGVTEMRMADGWKISIVESEKPISLNDLSFSMTADFARQLAALLLAAADKVEAGNG